MEKSQVYCWWWYCCLSGIDEKNLNLTVKKDSDYSCRVSHYTICTWNQKFNNLIKANLLWNRSFNHLPLTLLRTHLANKTSSHKVKTNKLNSIFFYLLKAIFSVTVKLKKKNNLLINYTIYDRQPKNFINSNLSLKL